MSTPDVAPPAPPPKQRHTAAEKAQASLDTSNRKLEKLSARLGKALQEVELLEIAIINEVGERDYFASHPALANKAAIDKIDAEVIGADGIRTDPAPEAIPPF